MTVRTGRPNKTDAAELQERLRRAAVEAFLEHGFDGTSMEGVAAAAGISKRTLYAYHPNKHSLFTAAVGWALARQQAEPASVQPASDDLADALTAIGRAILRRAVDPDVVRLSRMAMTESARFPEFAAQAHTLTWSPRMRAVMEILRRHAETGEVVVDDVELAAEQFIALVALMPARLAAFGVYRTADVQERHLQHAVTLFLRGVLAR